MKRIFAFTIAIMLFIMVCDTPAISELVSEDPYKIYNEYRTLLFDLQKDIAHLYLNLQKGKNPQAVYQHLLQAIESTAIVIGNAEVASQNVYDGFQGSLKGTLEILWEFGLSEEQETELENLGYTQKDISKMVKSIAYHNDYYHHAVKGFTSEQVQRFHSMGLTDMQIAELQDTIHDHYVEIHTLQEEIKHQQRELLNIQVSLSLAAIMMLLDQKEKGNNNGKGNDVRKAEEKLLEAVLNSSEDQSSLERVKAYSNQVLKAAEQKIRNGEDQYMVDFFVGLQVHCGAVTALNGDAEFGLMVIKSSESILSDLLSSEGSDVSYVQNKSTDEQMLSPDDFSLLEFVGQVKESDETNNSARTVVLIKKWGVAKSDFEQLMSEWGLPTMVQELFRQFLDKCIGVAAGTAQIAVSAGGVVFTLIITAPPVGGSWIECVVDCMTGDPSGTFSKIYEDEETIATIESKADDKNLDICEREGYGEVYTDPMQIVYTIMLANRVYRSPDNHYFFYMVDYTHEWVVEVEFLGHTCCGRVVEAYRVDCGIFKCDGVEYNTIIELWVLCKDFTLIWTRL